MSAIDEALDAVEVSVKLGLASWAWVLSYLPETDGVSSDIRRAILKHPDLQKSKVLNDLLMHTERKAT